MATHRPSSCSCIYAPWREGVHQFPFPGETPITVYRENNGDFVTRDRSIPGGPPQRTDEVFREAKAAFFSRTRPCNQQRPEARDTIWVLRRPFWGFMFYIRVNLGGSFHTYPYEGGPFQSLQEADNAITHRLHDREVATMCVEQSGVSLMEMSVRNCLYWPEYGTRKAPRNSKLVDERRDWTRNLAHALVDKYNEDHYLLGDLGHELKDVVRYQLICEGESYQWYYHINFTAKTKRAGHSDCNLFFAEITCVQGEPDALVVSCLCMINSADNGICYGCQNNGSVGMKHPNNADYTGGHMEDAYLPFASLPRQSGLCSSGGYKKECSASDFEAEEARIRRMFKGLDNPLVLDKLKTPNWR